MSKGILSFNLPEEQEEFKLAQNGAKYSAALDEVWEQLFRPYYKHGYNNKELNRALQTVHGIYVLETLAEMYKQIKISGND